MTTIAVQAAVGSLGSKATTEQSFQFNSMCNLGNIQVGANETGLYLLNQSDVVQDFESSFTLATTSLNTHNPKSLVKLFIGINTAESFDVHMSYDDSDERTYTKEVKKDGLQRLTVPIGTQDQGKYITIRISSNSWFSIDSVEGIFIARSTGITGYS